MPIAIANRAISQWLSSYFNTQAVTDKLKAMTKFELKKIAAEKAAQLAKIAATQQGRQALLWKGVLGGMGLLGSGGLAVAGTYGVKSLTESKTAWSKAKAEVWAEAKKLEEILRDALDVVKPEDVADARFDKVIGQDEARRKFEGVLERLANPQRYQTGGKNKRLALPTLLVGEAGLGKTEMVRALVNEARLRGIDPLFIRLQCNQLGFRDTGSKIIAELGKLIKEAGNKTPIVLMDELESLPRRTDEKASEGAKQATRAVMEKMDGIIDDKTLWFAMTNHPELVDPALKSRFLHEIAFSLPAPEHRLKLFEQNQKANELHPSETIDWDAMVKASDGLSGRDIKGIMAVLKEQAENENQIAPQGGHTFTPAQLQQAITNAIRKKRAQAIADNPLTRRNPAANPFGLPSASELLGTSPVA